MRKPRCSRAVRRLCCPAGFCASTQMTTTANGRRYAMSQATVVWSPCQAITGVVHEPIGPTGIVLLSLSPGIASWITVPAVAPTGKPCSASNTPPIIRRSRHRRPRTRMRLKPPETCAPDVKMAGVGDERLLHAAGGLLAGRA